MRVPEESKYIWVEPKYVLSNLLKHVFFHAQEHKKSMCDYDEPLLFSIIVYSRVKEDLAVLQREYAKVVLLVSTQNK